MTVYFYVGRRVPKSWFRRQASIVGGLITFQENIWMIIKQSLGMAKRKANASGKIKFVMTQEKEKEDMNYDIEWLKIVIQGTKEQEQDEYNDCLKLYEPLAKLFKKNIVQDDRMKAHFKTKMLSAMKMDEAYKKGYGAAGDSNISNKLLEMGILTYLDWVQDFDTREEEFKPDF